MKGDAKVVEILNETLKNELTAINQYFLHYRMLKHWGVERLAKTEYEESIDEMKHADELISRILYLDGVPNLQKLGRVHVGETVFEQFRLDLALEQQAIALLNRGIAQCRDAGDNGSRDLLIRILLAEENHLDWLETQLHLVSQVGEANYLARQMDPAG